MAEQLTRSGIMAWRKAERARLLAERRAMPSADRLAASRRIADTLFDAITAHPAGVVSLYWPINAEPNLIPLVGRLEDRGFRCALPIVVAKAQPLRFGLWSRGEDLARGVWNIPVPANVRSVVPDILVAPVVGFDPLCYRLGYGGGFFDRTLASLPGKVVIGVGLAAARLPTIHPLDHDIPLDGIVTERRLLSPETV